MNLFSSIRDQAARVEQTRENGGRLAEAHGLFRTSGWGEMAFQDVIEFGLSFVDAPAIAYGAELNPGQTLVDTRFPRSWGGVYQWKRDAKGLYVGAYCYAVIDAGSIIPAGDPGYTLTHHFTFTGIAIKGLPAGLALGGAGV